MALHLNRFKKYKMLWPFTVSLHLPEGLIGFQEFRDFILVANEHEKPFLWLETEKNDIAFVVMDPFLAAPDYKVLITESDLKGLSIKNKTHLFLLSIVNTKNLTINLAAPILVDWTERQGRQILVPASTAYPIDSTIF